MRFTENHEESNKKAGFILAAIAAFGMIFYASFLGYVFYLSLTLKLSP